MLFIRLEVLAVWGRWSSWCSSLRRPWGARRMRRWRQGAVPSGRCRGSSTRTRRSKSSSKSSKDFQRISNNFNEFQWVSMSFNEFQIDRELMTSGNWLGLSHHISIISSLLEPQERGQRGLQAGLPAPHAAPESLFGLRPLKEVSEKLGSCWKGFPQGQRLENQIKNTENSRRWMKSHEKEWKIMRKSSKLLQFLQFLQSFDSFEPCWRPSCSVGKVRARKQHVSELRMAKAPGAGSSKRHEKTWKDLERLGKARETREKLQKAPKILRNRPFKGWEGLFDCQACVGTAPISAAPASTRRVRS